MAELFSDFNFNFEPHPLTGDIGIVTGENSIEQSIQNLVRTSKYERPLQPSIHASISDVLFEPFTAVVEQTLRSQLLAVIEDHEPRVDSVDEIVIQNQTASNALVIQIFFRIRASLQTQRTQVILKRDG